MSLLLRLGEGAAFEDSPNHSLELVELGGGAALELVELDGASLPGGSSNILGLGKLDVSFPFPNWRRDWEAVFGLGGIDV